MKKVMIMCSGLGHVNRGYESFSKELDEELKEANVFDLTLLKGAGKSEKNNKTPFCLKRNGRTAAIINKITKKLFKIYAVQLFVSMIKY